MELIPLCTFTAELSKPFVLRGTPAGDRLIFEVVAGTITGERLRATLKGHAAADWLTIGPDGTGTLDVKFLVETHDDALVFVHYNGRVDTTQPGAPTYATPRFETGDDRYRWLNTIQAVGKGVLADDGITLTYEICEVR